MALFLIFEKAGRVKKMNDKEQGVFDFVHKRGGVGNKSLRGDRVL
jgi:hypothetical protein